MIMLPEVSAKNRLKYLNKAFKKNIENILYDLSIIKILDFLHNLLMTYSFHILLGICYYNKICSSCTRQLLDL